VNDDAPVVDFHGMHPPTLTMLYAPGCPACDEAKPELRRLASALPRGWRVALLNLETPNLNLDFPVQYTPTLHFAYEGRRFSTDPARLKHPLNASVMRLWLAAAVAKVRNGK